MSALTPLTPGEAERFLARLPFEQRLHVSIVGKHGGFQSVPVLSAEEFVKVSQALAPVFALDALERWVSEELGDAELASALREACEAEPIFKQAQPAHALISARIVQAKAALGMEDQLAASA